MRERLNLSVMAALLAFTVAYLAWLEFVAFA